jgi:hypothetical protein
MRYSSASVNGSVQMKASCGAYRRVSGLMCLLTVFLWAQARGVDLNEAEKLYLQGQYADCVAMAYQALEKRGTQRRGRFC